MSIDYKYIYGHRAVAFIDVLGFQNKLSVFEQDAIDYREMNIEDEDDIDENSSVLYSQQASEFIETFDSAIKKLDTEKFSYYLFSDNICITAQNGESSLIELLLVICELYFEFVQKGYFLRGGIDYGLFIDKSSIALGVPLATAYKMESSQAVFPRIILSEKFIKQLKQYLPSGESEFGSVLTTSLIKQSCEISYLNIFNHIFKVGDKEFFLKRYYDNISENLSANKEKEHIFFKYKWLANEFNSFLNDYIDSYIYLDENFEATEEYISYLKQLKIANGQ